MLVDEMTSSSFVKKNNSYSHCPLKKRPVTTQMDNDDDDNNNNSNNNNENINVVNKINTIVKDEWKPTKIEIKEEAIEITDDVQEPENLSTKPEDLRKTSAPKRRAMSPLTNSRNDLNEKIAVSPVQTTIHTPTPIIKRTYSPVSYKMMIQQQHNNVSPPTYHLNYPHYPTKANTPPMSTMPMHPGAKKVRIEVLKHNVSPPPPRHFGTGNTLTSTTPNDTASSLIASLAHGRVATAVQPPPPPPLHPTPEQAYSQYLYPDMYHHHSSYDQHHTLQQIQQHHHHHHQQQQQQLHHHHHHVAYSSPDYHHVQSISPSPPQSAVTINPASAGSNVYAMTTLQRSLTNVGGHNGRNHFWPSPEHCGLSPTGSLMSSVSLRSPPLVTPEDLSSPGSDSGRSSAGSTCVGSSSIVKLEKSTTGRTSPITSSSSMSSSATRYQCPDCQKSYSTYSGLSKHQQFHCSAAEGQTKKIFSCKNCEKVYYTLGALKMHIRTHTLPCKCDTCGKAFSRPWLLQGHIRTHTGEKPFVCQHCNRAFADRSNLRAHLQTHSDVKKYSCPSCSKTFSRMSLLTKHQEGGCPGGAAVYQCPA